MGTLRFILAFAVAIGHISSTSSVDISLFLGGSRAVQIFYMISGFLMALILNGKYPDGTAGNRVFWINRAVKIFVPYFVVLALAILACLLWKAFTGRALMLNAWFDQASNMTLRTWAYGILTNTFIVGQEWGFLLVYRDGSIFYSLHAFEQPPMASQFIIDLPTWTISIELMFYAIAPFLLRRHVLVIAAVAYSSSWLRFQGYHFGFYSEATNYRFFPFELSLFLYGAVCFKLGKMLTSPGASVTNTIVAIVLAIAIFRPRYYVASQYELYCLVGVLLPSLFDFSRRYRWDRVIGDLSYPLYLVHWPIALMIGSVWHGHVSMLAAVATSIGAAVVLDRYVVIPVDRWRQERAERAKRRTESGGFAIAPAAAPAE